jgi:cytoskeletal protein CcmA (bactofilin family)
MMIGSKKKGNTMEATKTTPSSKLINSLVLETNVEGTIKTNNDIRIDGTIIGTLICQGKVIIGTNGKVDGQIQCHNSVIEGTFKGKIEVSELMVVQETAKVEGDVITEKLQVEPGAIFNVSCTMGGQQIRAQKSKPAEAGKDN